MPQTKKAGAAKKATTKAKSKSSAAKSTSATTKAKKVATKVTSDIDHLVPTLEELLEAGVHFGHTTKRWHPAMATYIYKKKGNIHIIDIRKTQTALENALRFLNEQVATGHRDILIIGTKKQVSNEVKEFATKYNLYYVADKWLGGLFTNFKVVQRSLQTLEQLEEEQIKLRYILTKQELAARDRRISKLRQRLEGVMFMPKLPSAVIVIDGKHERIAVKEARLADIPLVGVIDTNTDPRFIDYPIPANDDATKSIMLFLGIFGKVLAGRTNDRLGKDRADYAAKLDVLSNRIDQEYKARMALEQKKDLASQVVEQMPMGEGDTGRFIKVAATRLEVLNFPPSLIEKLEKGGIRSVEILSNKTSDEVRAMEGIGPKTAERVMAALQKYLKSKQ